MEVAKDTDTDDEDREGHSSRTEGVVHQKRGMLRCRLRQIITGHGCFGVYFHLFGLEDTGGFSGQNGSGVRGW